MKMDFITIFLLAACIADVSFGQTSSSEDGLRIPLFPETVQNFAIDALRIFQTVYGDPEIVSAKHMSPEELFTFIYRLLKERNEVEGNPNTNFHAVCKARAFYENYDGAFLQLVTAYTAGELLLQNEILTAVNQNSLSKLLAQEVINGFNRVTNPTLENYFTAGYSSYMDFLKSQGVITPKKAFTEPAVFIEVMNALRLYV